MPESKSLTAKFNFILRKSSGKVFLYAVPVVILVIFASAIAFDKLFVPQPPIGSDVGLYAVVAHELLNGRTLYVDVWDHKPPVIFITYAIAEAIFGYSAETIFLLQIFAGIVVLLGIFYAGKAGRGGIVTGLLAAFLWVLVSGKYEIESQEPNTEVFINACIIWAFALLARKSSDGLSKKVPIITGLLFLLGSFYKPVVAAYAVFLAVAHILAPPGGSVNRNKAVLDVVKMSAVSCAGWVLMFLYFAFTNRLEIFYKTIISYNSFYSGNTFANIISPIQNHTEILIDFMNPLAVFAFAGIIFTFFTNRRQSLLLASFIASTWVAIALPGKFYSHYYQLWLPPLIVGASWAIGYLFSSDKTYLRLLSFPVGAVLIGVLIFHQIPYYKAALEKNWLNFTNAKAIAADETAQYVINNLLTEDETFFILGNDPTLYFLTRRPSPAPVFFADHLDESPVSDFLRKRVAEDLERNRPEILIVEGEDSPVSRWIEKDYKPLEVSPNNDVFRFYLRRGGRLDGESDSR